MEPTVLLPLRKKVWWGFFRPKKSDGFGQVWNRILGYQRRTRYLYTTEAIVMYLLSWKTLKITDIEFKRLLYFYLWSSNREKKYYIQTFLSFELEIINIWDLFEPRSIYLHTIYTGCPRRNVPDFGSVFLMLKYTDITQNTYIQSWTVTEIMAREKWGLLAVPNTATCTADASR
jgi:hypothetical protein